LELERFERIEGVGRDDIVSVLLKRTTAGWRFPTRLEFVTHAEMVTARVNAVRRGF